MYHHPPGGPFFDQLELIRNFDPRYISIHFSIHATGCRSPQSNMGGMIMMSAPYVGVFVWKDGVVEKLSSEPSSCADSMTYDFIRSDQAVGLQPRTWLAGTAHPFFANVLRSDTPNNWVCALGYKWVDPSDSQSLACIAQTIGLIGIDLKLDDGAPFPTIANVRRNTPASQAGIEAGSYLIQVDGISTSRIPLDQVVARTRGTVNTVVRMMVMRPGGQTQVFTLIRQ